MTEDLVMEQEETFGLVMAISRFNSVDDAFRRANNSPYGLEAVVFGKQEARKVADRLEAGMVGINQGVGAGDAPGSAPRKAGSDSTAPITGTGSLPRSGFSDIKREDPIALNQKQPAWESEHIFPCRLYLWIELLPNLIANEIPETIYGSQYPIVF